MVLHLRAPDSPLELGLDKPEWREHQKETVDQILDAYQTSDRVLLNAPTGAGKTIIGAALARCLSGDALYLAHTIQLQQQQLSTLPDAVTCTGRSNHPCINATYLMMNPDMTAADADCPCEHAVSGGCGYYDQWFRAMAAQDVVLNYAFVVRTIKGKGLRTWGGKVPNPFKNRGLMVCDEGHNLESALLDADGVDFYQRTWEEFGYEVPRTTDYGAWVEWRQANHVPLEADVDSVTESRRAAGPGNRDLWSRERKLKSMLMALEQMPVTTDHTPVYVGRTSYGYRVRPLWAWNRSNDILFKYAPKTLIMSATMGEPHLAAKLLGLENWSQVTIPSTFPVANRPVYYWPVSRMKHGMEESEKQKQVVALAHLARKFPNSPGVVHCNSFALGRYLADGIRSLAPDVSPRVLLHDSTNVKSRTFEPFQTHEGLDNAILITPSATTGVDWDFVGWQMIPKVPFPDLGDEFTRLRYDYVTDEGEAIGKEVYTQEAVKTLVQAAGRNVRTPTSKGVTVVTDSAFWPLFKYNAPKAFPDWFRAAVQWYEPKGAS